MTLIEIKESPKPMFITGRDLKNLFSSAGWAEINLIEDEVKIRIEDTPRGGLLWIRE